MTTYGERLREAMAYRSAQLGSEVTRLELSKAAGCSRQNIGMILTNAQGLDQKLSTESHAKAAAFLHIDPNWLLTGDGQMVPQGIINRVMSGLPAIPQLASNQAATPVSSAQPAINRVAKPDLMSALSLMYDSLPDDPALRAQVFVAMTRCIEDARNAWLQRNKAPVVAVQVKTEHE